MVNDQKERVLSEVGVDALTAMIDESTNVVPSLTTELATDEQHESTKSALVDSMQSGVDRSGSELTLLPAHHSTVNLPKFKPRRDMPPPSLLFPALKVLLYRTHPSVLSIYFS